MKLTNVLNLPEAIVNAVKNDSYSPGDSDITVTQLIGPPRIRVLRQRHRDEISEDVSEYLWRLYGQAVHSVIERAADNDLAESRIYAVVNGWRVGGQLDNLRLQNGKLSDYKMTSVWAVKNGAKPEWEAQLNVLAMLLDTNRYPVSEAEIVALLKDWRRAESLRDKDYPKVPAKVVPINLWSESEQLQYVFTRVKMHQEAEHGIYLPLCTDEERWATEPCFAVMKKNNKKATKLFRGDNGKEQAEQFVKDHKDGAIMSIEERPRTYNRCEAYCEVAPFCEQWQETKKGEIDE